MTTMPRLVTEGFLDGLTVVELSTRVAGAYAGKLLQLMGATVRRADSPLMADCPLEYMDDLGFSLNDRKQSLVADARELIAAVQTADLLLIDSLHDDAFDGEWTRITRELVHAAPPRVPVIDVAAHRSDAGHDKGYPASSNTEAGTPFTAAAAGGMSWALGRPGAEPLAPPYDLADYFAGSEAAGAAVTALFLKVSGVDESQHWSVSASDAIAYYTGQITSNFIYYERPWMRDGSRAAMSGGFYPSAMFPTKDGYITLVCRSPHEWDALRAAMGNPKWSRDARFADARVVARHHADEADRYLSAWTKQHTSAEIAAIADKHKLPNALILTPNEVLEVPQFAHHELFDVDQNGIKSIPNRFWRTYEPAQTSKTVSPLEMSPTLQKPLAGLRILDLTWVWAGPMMTAGLAELGADIIKVESSARPDSSRLRGAAIRNGVPVEGPELEVSPYYNQMNRGKRSTTINIATAEGAELVRQMAEECDVVIENMRPGALARKGLDYSALVERNPGITMVSLAMMGQSGPMSDIGGYAPVMSGLAGLDAITGYSADDLIGNFNPSPGDPNGADHATALLIAALIRRRRTGRGCWLDISQIEALVSVMRVPFAIAARGDRVPVPANGHAHFFPHGNFRCEGEDAWIAVAVRTGAERARLASLIGADDLTADTLHDATARWTRGRSASEAEERLRRIGIAASELVGIEALIAGDLSSARQLYHEYSHPYLGDQKLFGLPWKLNGSAFASSLSAPGLGAHNEEVLVDDLGILDERGLTRLMADGVIR